MPSPPCAGPRSASESSPFPPPWPKANLDLGFKEDLRDYGIAAQILRELGISKVRLLTNNPRKIAGLQRYGVQVVERIALESTPHDDNIDYLRTKREKLGHFFSTLPLLT